MKFSAVAAVAFAALVSAQSKDDIPSCAIPCLDDAVKSKTSCSTTDFACICKKENFSAIQGAATSCVISKCGPEKAVGEVLPATQKLCAAAGKPDSSSPPSSAPSSDGGAAPTSTAGPTTAAPTTQASQPAVTNCPTTVATQPTVPCNGTAPATSAPVTAGAAGLAPIGGLAMLAIGALAL
ncbi:hypothetical protein QQS21_004860 [Conoideocrella luteorostrata]|uniref:CFEM domain-containing protein n=1 Tax=Conoideocrella luteorostrata TaxID=1105319 RepID=A0AAJ0CT34_9HYPO|nr:hypothetical protein QQS21_004860 [Conoideocrella luteorostrata]